MAIVTCPECGKKLKIADTSVGKKVKCSCTHIFVAATEPAAAPPPAVKKPPATAALTTEKVFVSCTECDAKLKVATSSLGRKMKCPKCASVFVANLPEDTAPRGGGLLGTLDRDDLEEAPKPKAKGKGKPAAKDEMDDLFMFAQEEDLPPPDEEALPPPKPKKKWDADEEDELPRSRSKAKKPVKPSRRTDEEESEAKPPVYPSRLLLNLVVTAMLLGYLGLFVLVFFDLLGTDLHDLLNAPKARPAPVITKKGNDPDLKKPPVTPKVEPAKLEGAWAVERAENGGQPLKEMLGVRFVFAGGKVKSPNDENAYLVDDAKTPVWIDTIVSKELSLPGIYKIEGDRLHWCVATPDMKGKVGPRPTDFDSKQGMLLVLKSAADEVSKPAPLPYNPDRSKANLEAIAQAIDQYRARNMNRLPTDVHDSTGKPLLSWRVALLPHLNGAALHGEFDLTRPWDDPHNLKALGKMPGVYAVPGTYDTTGKTHYRSPTGPATAFAPQKGPDGATVGRPIVSLTDGTSNVITVIETKEGIEWTRPDNLPVDPPSPLPKLGIAPDGAHAAFADGTVKFIPAKVSEDALRPYLTVNNGIPRSLFDPDEKKVDPKDKKEIDEKKVEPKANLEEAVEKTVRMQGGFVVRDDKAPDRPIVEVMAGSKTTDADLPALAGLPRLRQLKLRSTKVTGVGLRELAGLKELEHLDLSFSQVSDEGLKELAALKGLKSVSLLNSKVTNDGIKELLALPDLEQLNLSQNRLNDEAVQELLAGLKRLRKLELGNTQTGDETAKVIGGLANLESLHLHGTNLTDEGIKSFAGLTRLIDLRLSFRTTDEGLKHLANLKELRVLNLFATSIGDAGVQELAGLTKMENLDLTGARVTDKAIESMAGMKQMKILRLDGTAITDASLKTIADMKGLQMLFLAETKITDAGLQELHRTPSLNLVLLRGTKLSDTAIADLKKALPKCQVLR